MLRIVTNLHFIPHLLRATSSLKFKRALPIQKCVAGTSNGSYVDEVGIVPWVTDLDLYLCCFMSPNLDAPGCSIRGNDASGCSRNHFLATSSMFRYVSPVLLV